MTSRPSLRWTLAAAAVVIIVVVGLLQFDLGALPLLQIAFLTLALVFPVSWISVTALTRGWADILSPVFLVPATFGVVFGNAAPVLTKYATEAQSALVMSSLVAGITSYWLGVGVSLVVLPWLGRQKRPISLAPTGDPRRKRMVVKLAFIVGVIAMAVYWQRAGGIPLLAGDLENSRISALTGSGIPFYLSMLVMVAVWLSFDPATQFTTSHRIVLVTIGCGLMVSTGWRNTVFALAVVALLTLHYLRPIKTKWIVLGGAVSLIGMSVFGLYRIVASRIVTYQSYIAVSEGDYAGALFAYLTSYFDAFVRNLATVFSTVPNRLDFQGGATFVWNFLALNPDSNLEPFDFVLKTASGQGFEGGGLPATLIGEWYVNFGTVGIVIGMMLIGFIASFAHKMLLSSTSFGSRLIAILGVYYLFVAVRGGLGNVLLTFTWLALTIAILTAFGNSARRPADVRPARREALYAK